jgi:hypothetical protein
MKQPPMKYDDFDSNRLAHLNMIQGVVSRLASNSFYVKGWAITISAGLLGFALSAHKTLVAGVAAVPIVAFWLIDAYYLRAERLFRALYDDVRSKSPTIEPFGMGATSKDFVNRVKAARPKTASWRFAFLSLTIAVLYIGLLAVTGALTWKIYSDNHPGKDHKTSSAAAIRTSYLLRDLL